jgi:hypothetical protein
MKMDPVDLGVANCPWVGERDDADLSGVSKAGA